MNVSLTVGTWYAAFQTGRVADDGEPVDVVDDVGSIDFADEDLTDTVEPMGFAPLYKAL